MVYVTVTYFIIVQSEALILRMTGIDSLPISHLNLRPVADSITSILFPINWE